MNTETYKAPDSVHYNSIDGLRAFSAIGIILMHVLANGKYMLEGPVFEKIIPSFTNLVFLFMVISGFSMCCGYYDKVINGKISPGEFYSRRYIKIWPYFALLCLLDIVISPSIDSLYEVFANLTLCFGFLPNANITVIGVGWTLGVIFIFYLIFPFFCYLISDKKRAWFAFAVTIIFNVVCTRYFFDKNHVPDDFSMRSNFIYCAMFFMAGGLIFIYRRELGVFAEKYRWIVPAVAVITIVIYYTVNGSVMVMLAMFSVFVIYTLGKNDRGGVLANGITRFVSGISMEIYLCHMVVYRIAEKAGLVKAAGNGILSYIVMCLIVIVGAVGFSCILKYLIKRAGVQWEKIMSGKHG